MPNNKKVEVILDPASSDELVKEEHEIGETNDCHVNGNHGVEFASANSLKVEQEEIEEGEEDVELKPFLAVDIMSLLGETEQHHASDEREKKEETGEFKEEEFKSAHQDKPCSNQQIVPNVLREEANYLTAAGLLENPINECKDYGGENLLSREHPPSETEVNGKDVALKNDASGSSRGENFSFERGKEFAHKFTFVSRVPQSEENPFVCDRCGLAFRERTDFLGHLREHGVARTYMCDVCCKGFKSSSFLIMHSISHRADKPYKCYLCGKGMKMKGDLIKHIKLHSGEKPYECSLCRKVFSAKGSLKIHMMHHSGEKPFQCSDCGKRFSRKTVLAKHSQFHSGERPYKCDDCGKSFGSKWNLLSHIRSHSGEKPFKCNICKKRFTRKDVLAKHSKVCH